MQPQEWADAVIAFGVMTAGGATLEDIARGRALVDAMPGEGLPGVWRDVGELLACWVRRREELTRVIGFHVPLGTLDRAMADMPRPAMPWQTRKDVA